MQDLVETVVLENNSENLIEGRSKDRKEIPCNITHTIHLHTNFKTLQLPTIFHPEHKMA